jgi:UDP-2-acetamido-2-deoxy-ribo-hexuluronate aminotransferase
MDFIDLKTQQKAILPALTERIQRVLAHGQYILGPEVKELEERLAAYVGVKHTVSCFSGTDALLMTLMAYGVGSGDAIFTTPFTFIATAEVIQLLGATPVFVDIDPETFNIDPDALHQAIIKLTKNPKTSSLQPKGIIPVDLFGQPADYDAINTLARQNNLFVLEDAAQSFGSTYKGRKAGSLADVAATSFFPAKPLGGYGEGGAFFQMTMA